MKEKDIIKKAVYALERNVGLEIKIVAKEPKKDRNLICTPDARFKIIWGDQAHEFYVEIRNVINRPIVGMIIDRFKTHPENTLLIAPYINPNIAEDLKKSNIQFLDAAGNAFINKPPLYVYLKGNKPPEDFEMNAIPKAFNDAGLRFVFTLLCNPQIINMKYREMANQTQVALGTVHNIIKKMKQDGHLADTGNGMRFIRKKELIDKWVIQFPLKLRHKLLLGRYQEQQEDWWKSVDILEFGAQWGGEAAADKMTDYLKPYQITIYMDAVTNEFLLKNKLRPDKKGNVEILEKFWTETACPTIGETVPPLLVYADLMALAEQRAVETAGIIYEQHIAGLIEQG